jgi:hypothetical protein
MKKRVHERVWPALMLAAAGFGLLAIALPEWARAEVALFGVVFGALVVVVDDDLRDALRGSLDSRSSRTANASIGGANDPVRAKGATSGPARAPASSRAAI